MNTHNSEHPFRDCLKCEFLKRDIFEWTGKYNILKEEVRNNKMSKIKEYMFHFWLVILILVFSIVLGSWIHGCTKQPFLPGNLS
jgi:hypothetical protein